MSSSTIIGKNRTHSIAKESEKEKKSFLLKELLCVFIPTFLEVVPFILNVPKEPLPSSIYSEKKERKKNENMK